MSNEHFANLSPEACKLIVAKLATAKAGEVLDILKSVGFSFPRGSGTGGGRKPDEALAEADQAILSALSDGPLTSRQIRSRVFGAELPKEACQQFASRLQILKSKGKILANKAEGTLSLP